MRRVNIADPELAWDEGDPDGFRAGTFRLGPLVGAAETGMSVYELPPGQSICPYHYENGEEEWLVVLTGRPTLRHPGGSDALDPWDVVCFPSGPDGAHAVRNDTEETARVLMFSTVRHPAVTVYPDSDKLGVWTSKDKADNVIVRRSSTVDYWDGETADPPRSP